MTIRVRSALNPMMNVFRRSRVRREVSEQLLAGYYAPGSRALATLLGHARAPAQPAELRGEEAAVAMFRSARSSTPAPAAPARSGLSRVVVMNLTAAAATLAAGGLAVAGVTGGLPGAPFGPSVQAPAGAGSTDTRPGATPATSPTDLPGTTGPRSPGANGTPAPPDAKYLGLCAAIDRMPPDQMAKALKTPAYAGLVMAAAGADRVPAFCAVVLASATPGPTDPAPANPVPATPTPATPGPATPTPTAEPTVVPSESAQPDTLKSPNGMPSGAQESPRA